MQRVDEDNGDGAHGGDSGEGTATDLPESWRPAIARRGVGLAVLLLVPGDSRSSRMGGRPVRR